MCDDIMQQAFSLGTTGTPATVQSTQSDAPPPIPYQQMSRKPVDLPFGSLPSIGDPRPFFSMPQRSQPPPPSRAESDDRRTLSMFDGKPQGKAPPPDAPPP